MNSIKKSKIIKVAFLGSANWDLLALDFVNSYRSIVDQEVIVLNPPFRQYHIQLIDEYSELRHSSLDFYIFCERFEDLFEVPITKNPVDSDTVATDKFEEYLDLIRFARHELRGQFVVLSLAPICPMPLSLADASNIGNSVNDFLHSINGSLGELCHALPDCHLLDLGQLVTNYGANNACPGKYWHMAKMPFNSGFNSFLSQKLIGLILATRGETARVLVLDLDNTLWGGVVGDDGLSGIKLGGEFPGSVFVDIQKYILALKSKGFLLAVCSKNIDKIAIEAIKLHPDMVLSFEDFVAVKINWNEKADNIRAIAEEIGVGVASICLIDDSPYEREAIRRLLPELIVPELPGDHMQWPTFFRDYPFFAMLSISKEDIERTSRQKNSAKIRNESLSCSSKEDFLRSLNMIIYFKPLNSTNMQRVMQLIAKTNQFNMTAKRYTEAELLNMQSENYTVLSIGLSDKYSSQEVVGVVILKLPIDKNVAIKIDNLLLSCRVLGRTVEKGVLGWICKYSLSRGYKFLEGLFIETDRNVTASRVYQENGFINDNGVILLDILERSIPIPDWFVIKDEI